MLHASPGEVTDLLHAWARGEHDALTRLTSLVYEPLASVGPTAGPITTTIMRRLLVDAARARATLKRGGELQRVAHQTGLDFETSPATDSQRASQMCRLDDALDAFPEMDPRAAQVWN